MKRLLLIASALAAMLNANSRLALSSPVADWPLVAHGVSAELHRDCSEIWSATAAECFVAPSSITPRAIPVERIPLDDLSTKQLSRLREARVQFKLEGKFGKTNVLTERTLLNSAGQKVLDPVTGVGRRIDNVVIGPDGRARYSVEVTSRRQVQISGKADQLTRELRIRDAGGTFVRDPHTGRLIDVSNIPTRVIGVEPL